VQNRNPIYVEGRLKYGKYTDKDGVEKSTCDIVATELQLLGSREQQPAQRQAPEAPKSQGGGTSRPARSNAGGFEDMDDDIPFRNPMRGVRCFIF